MYHSLAFIILTVACSCDALRILVLNPLPFRSHAILGDGIVRHLSQAGHEITYITAYPHEKPAARVREIDVSSITNIDSDSLFSLEAVLNKESKLSPVNFIVDMTKFSGDALKHPSVQNLLLDPDQKFDVIIAEWMFSDLYSGLAAVFQSPLIWLSPVEPHWKILQLIDEIPNPAYNSDDMSGNVPPFSLKQRLQELAFQIGGSLMKYFYASETEYKNYDEIVAPIIRKRGHPVPSFDEVRYNASLVLGNSHESLGKTMRLPSSYKAIGGYHIEPNVQPLPEDLKQIMDNAKNGVIYFSMGSILKSKLMPSELKQSLLKMLGSLKQTVLWKFEEDFPNRPSNVHILNWAPQPSILNHPNCKLFITHGGLLSTTEAIHFGKPIIGIPVFADQFSNIDRAVAKGFAKKVDLSYTMADDIKIAVEEILGDPKYAVRAKELSFIYHHRPAHPSKEIVHWVEHVAKTGGARHLRSPALDVPLYQKFYLDLLAIILALLYIIKISITSALAAIMGKINYSITLEEKKSL